MIVIEASAVVDALVAQPPNPRLLAVIADDDLHAPALLDYEVASALRGRAISRQLPDGLLAEAVSDFGGLRIARHSLSRMMSAVLALRSNFTSYDAAYVVLADVLDVPLVTADEKLAEARRLGVDVQIFTKEQR